MIIFKTWNNKINRLNNLISKIENNKRIKGMHSHYKILLHCHNYNLLQHQIVK